MGHMGHMVESASLRWVAMSMVAVLFVARLDAQTPAPQVLFVCEHGNVKSLMAASYFNRLAEERGLAVRAISRGTAPDSPTVPPAIVGNLRGDGFDVSGFQPVAVGAADVTASKIVITIGTTLPAAAQVSGVVPETWNDVPPASLDYPGSRASLQEHIRQLVERIATPSSPAKNSLSDPPGI